MGAEATLDVGIFNLAYSKGEYHGNHSELFLRSDLKTAAYEYYDDTGNRIVEQLPAFVRSLGMVKRRLDLLGYGLADCKQAFEACANESYEDDVPDFQDFASFVARINVADASDSDWHKFVQRRLFDADLCQKAPSTSLFVDDTVDYLRRLNPYVFLRLLAENPSNADIDVVWRIAEVVEAGYFEMETIYQQLATGNQWLIVTEGSSDSDILKSSLAEVVPDLSDFFYFVDMENSYPFTGTGNLVNFCSGLARIRVQNNVLVVLDNDTTGREALGKLKRVALPKNMRVTLLPQLETCLSVKTLGPSGLTRENINGRAVAIECFLDIWGPGSEPTVRWSSYSRDLDAYQGALVDKEHYTKRFHGRAKSEAYDLSGLTRLWAHLIGIANGTLDPSVSNDAIE